MIYHVLSTTLTSICWTSILWPSVHSIQCPTLTIRYVAALVVNCSVSSHDRALPSLFLSFNYSLMTQYTFLCECKCMAACMYVHCLIGLPHKAVGLTVLLITTYLGSTTVHSVTEYCLVRSEVTCDINIHVYACL